MNPVGIKRFLERGGLRCTPQRYAVIAFLMERASHGCGNLRSGESQGSSLFKGYDL
jgi:Fe2+ or Zn2+ uptake regulation protein